MRAPGCWARIQAMIRRTSHPTGRCRARRPSRSRRKYRSLGRASGARAVHRQDRENDVETEVLVQVPGPEQGSGPVPRAPFRCRECTPARDGFGSGPAGDIVPVAQHQCVLALIAGVAHPAFGAGFAGVGFVAAGDRQPFMGAAPVGEMTGSKRGREPAGPEEVLRLVQPAVGAVEVDRFVDLTVDLLVGDGSLSGRRQSRPTSTSSSLSAWVASDSVGRAIGRSLSAPPR